MFTCECDENDFELMLTVSNEGERGIFTDFCKFFTCSGAPKA